MLLRFSTLFDQQILLFNGKLRAIVYFQMLSENKQGISNEVSEVLGVQGTDLFMDFNETKTQNGPGNQNQRFN